MILYFSFPHEAQYSFDFQVLHLVLQHPPPHNDRAWTNCYPNLTQHNDFQNYQQKEVIVLIYKIGQGIYEYKIPLKTPGQWTLRHCSEVVFLLSTTRRRIILNLINSNFAHSNLAFFCTLKLLIDQHLTDFLFTAEEVAEVTER